MIPFFQGTLPLFDTPLGFSIELGSFALFITLHNGALCGLELLKPIVDFYL